MKRRFNQFLAVVMLASALAFSGCTKDSTTASGPEKAEAAEIGSSAKSSTSSAEAKEYMLREIQVEMNDVGRRSLLENGYTRLGQNDAGMYLPVPNDPTEPYDPILCDGMTYSQVWQDITNKWNAFKNSPMGQQAQDYANATCKPVYYCICNCAVCVMFVIHPTKRCYEYVDVLQQTKALKANLIIEQAP